MLPRKDRGVRLWWQHAQFHVDTTSPSGNAMYRWYLYMHQQYVPEFTVQCYELCFDPF